MKNKYYQQRIDCQVKDCCYCDCNECKCTLGKICVGQNDHQTCCKNYKKNESK